MKMMGHILKKHRRLTKILAAIVVFLTTYALILPALTLDKERASEQSGVTLASDNDSVTPSTAISEETRLSTKDEAPDPSASDEINNGVQAEEGEASPEEETEESYITEPTTLTFEGSNYRVSIDVDGHSKLPSNVSLHVNELQAEERERKQAEITQQLGEDFLGKHFYDISLWSDGKEVEPAGPVLVHFSYATPLEISRQVSLMAIHYHPGEGSEFLRLATKREDNKVSSLSFTTDHFSEYAIVQAPPAAINARVNDGKSLFNVIFQSDSKEITSISDIEAGTPLGQLPEAPFKQGYQFDSWKNAKTGETVTSDSLVTEDMVVEAVFTPISIYTVSVEYYYHNHSSGKDVVFDKETYQKEDKDTPFQITPPASTKVSRGEDTTLQADAVYYPEKPVVEIAQGQLADLDNADGQLDQQITIRVQFVPSTAEFQYVYLLKDLTGTGYSEMKRVDARGVLNSTVYPQILSFANANFERAEAQEITQASGQELKVYYTRKSYTLSYETDGGSYIEPQTGLYEEEVAITKTTPTRAGYDFAGWYESPDLTGSPISQKTKLSADKTLYAKWTPKKVNYTIVYYLEQYDNTTNSSQFVYHSARSAQGDVGTTVTASSAPGLTSTPVGYEIDTNQNRSSQVEIAADGSSVLKVYYKLKRYTFVFNLTGPIVGRNTYYRNGVISINGRDYTGSNYRISDVVLGQDISSLWPSGNQVLDSWNYYRFRGWSRSDTTTYFVTRRQKVTEDLIPKSGNQQIITYVASWDSRLSQQSVEYYLQAADNSAVYIKSNEFSQIFYSNGNLLAKEIDGFTARSSTPEGYDSSIGSTYRFYYDRKKYTIDYYYNGDKLTTKTAIPFDANINSATYNYTPPRPQGVDSDYTWSGWYADAGLTSPYRFSHMPNSNLALYAKWIAPTFKVDFQLNGGDGQAPPEQTIEKYKMVSAPANPSREHYDFVGWYTDPIAGSRYDWSKPVTADTTLYARWRLKPISYTVRYLEETSNTPLAAEKIETNPAFVNGQIISEDALAISGYRPAERSQSIQLGFENNVITFYYTKKAPTVTYTINYVLADNPAIEVAPSETKVVDGSWLSAKEKAVPVDKEHFGKQTGVTPNMLALDYYPVEDVQSLVLSSVSQNNVITFKYANYETAHIKVNYLDMDGNPIPGQDSLSLLKKKPGSYSVNRKAIPGYTFEKSIDHEKVENKTYYKISNGDQIEVNLYYKKNITLQALDKEKIYDGLPLVSTDLSDLSPDYQNELVGTDKLASVAFEGSQTEVGSSQTKPVTLKIVDATGKDRNYYYKVSSESGVLKVTPLKATVIINGERKEKTYDGQEESVSYEMTIADTNNLLKASDIVFNGANSNLRQKDAGVYDLNLEGQFINKNTNIEVTFQISNGQLKINPRKLILTSKSATKAYDGKALTAEEISVSSPGFVSGEGVTPVFTGSQTLPGQSHNTFTYQLNPNTKQDNYEIETEFGLLKVQPTLNLQKTDQNWQALSGGKFRVTKWHGNMWEAIDGAYELASKGSDGVNLPDGLSQGLYRIEELAAPDGYIVLGQDIYFKIDEYVAEDDSSSHYVFTITDEAGNPSDMGMARLQDSEQTYSHRMQIVNEPGKALPHTGGLGHQLILVIGSLLTAIALYGFYKRKAKN